MRKTLKDYLPIALLVALVLIMTMTAAVLLFGAQLQIRLNGDQNMPVEFGQTYEDAGAETVLVSKLFGEISINVPVTVSAAGVGGDLGEYTVTYSAKYLGLHATAQRTVRVVDTTAPVITLKYSDGSFTLPGHEYVEEGFVAEDNYDGDITDKVQRQVLGDRVIYTVQDSSGNTAAVQRTIHYKDEEPPVISLLGGGTVTIQVGEKFSEPGYTAIDNVDGDITAKVTVSKDYDIYKGGTYTITYTVTDSFGNTATATRTLVVKAASQQGTVNPGNKVIYLTFDDGPSEYTGRLLEVLGRYGVKATFFVCDKGAEQNKLMADIVKGGHAIGIHSQTHNYASIYSSVNAFLDDMNRMSDIIYANTGVRTKLLRFPGGSSNTISRNYCKGIMTELARIVQDMGYQYFDWNVGSNDTANNITADKIYSNVIAQCANKAASVVLQHDIFKESVDAVERIIQWGLTNGYTFKALDETSPTAHHDIAN